MGSVNDTIKLTREFCFFVETFFIETAGTNRMTTHRKQFRSIEDAVEILITRLALHLNHYINFKF